MARLNKKRTESFPGRWAAILAFLVLQFGFGILFSRVAEIIGAGLNTLT